MRPLFQVLLISALLLACTAAATYAFERRVALVVGNGAYDNAPALTNPVRDARAIADTLTSLGFDVLLKTDLAERDMADALNEFQQRLVGTDVALFYYAGHGMQFEGENYLIATDARLNNAFSLQSDAAPLAQVMQLMQTSVPVSIVLLDACRDNPFVERVRTSLPEGRSASVNHGLAPVPLIDGDTMMVFATAANSTAADGAGEHSPFAQALLDWLPAPGLELSQVMKKVVQDVRTTTKKLQRPEVLSSMASELFLAGATGNPDVEQFDRVNSAYKEAVETNTVSGWKSFLARFGDTSLADFARKQLAMLTPAEELQVAPALHQTRLSAEIRDWLGAALQSLAFSDEDLPPANFGDNRLREFLTAALLHSRVPSEESVGSAILDDLAEAAQGGFAPAQYVLGYASETGAGAPKDFAMAQQWYRDAAAGGAPRAQYALGLMYRFGLGVAADAGESGRFLMLAAEQGYAPAQESLGAVRALEGDTAEADKWLKLAAAQKYPAAQFDLGLLAAEREESLDIVNWLQLAAEGGSAIAALALGDAYLIGDGAPSDNGRAAAAYAAAHRAGASLGARALQLVVQTELNRLGCNAGVADGVWGRKSRDGLRRYLVATGGDPKAGLEDIAEHLREMFSQAPATCTQ